MTVRYRSATLGEFIEHHSYDVSRGGMFIKTPSPFPAGTLLKFEVKIAEEQRVMQGVGRVVWKRDSPVADTDEPAGMGIKFIKIDEGSRAVIERLLESRGGGTLGAFDRSPDQSAPGMFPSTENLQLPAPEDRTVMKPASELLAEALRKTAEETAPVSTRQATAGRSGGFETVRATPQSFGPPGFADDAESEPPPPSAARIPSLESLDRTQRSPLQSGAESPAKQRQASIPSRALEPEEEGGGGRALFLFVAVAAVAVGIWVLTKRGGENEAPPEPSTEMAPAQSAAPNAKPIDQPLPAEVELPETAPAPSAPPEGSAAPEASSAPAVAAPPAQAVVTAAPVPAPAPKPRPAVKKPKAAATTEPPAATPIPAAPTPTTAPSSTPKPTPAPAHAPPVKSEVENPY